MNKEIANTLIEKYKPEIIEISKHIHMYPEMG
jgi:metal-dependent amidase/aminoacylase/carboxypeptidase family protein